MKNSKKKAGLALSAVSAAAWVMMTAAPAGATTHVDIGQGSGACPTHYVCLWSEYDFIGSGGHKFGAIATDESIRDMGKLKRYGTLWKGMQDVTSSVLNNTGGSVCLYEHNGYGGLEARIGPGAKWSAVPSWINDRISSLRPC